MRKESAQLKSITKFVGFDVSKATIAVAIADARMALPLATWALRKLLNRLGRLDELLVCYEAGPTGFGLYRFLIALGVTCGGGSIVDASQTRRSCQNRSARCHSFGTVAQSR